MGVFFFFAFSSNTEFSLKCLAHSFKLNVQIKVWEENACTQPWPSGHQLSSRQPAQSVCACGVFVFFAAELTKLWPWHSLCWVLLQVECRNYIRTLHRVNDTTMYVCGTNAFSPTCDHMVSTLQNMELKCVCRQHLCPFSFTLNINPSLASSLMVLHF